MKKGTPVAVGRLQRWAIFLAMYNYEFVFRKGSKMGNADALSRLPLAETNNIEPENIHIVSESNAMNNAEIAKYTHTDEILKEVFLYVKDGWPNKCENEKLKCYHAKRCELSIDENCLYFRDRVVMPSKQRDKILDLFHETHLGIQKMKQSARRYVWWPTIDRDIGEFVKQCESCQFNQCSPSAVPLTSWKKTTRFFERVHGDLFHFHGVEYLIIVDTYSRWIDAKRMSSTKANAVINALRSIFAYFGLPESLVSDNGPPFASNEFLSFCKNNGIKCLKSPAYHPESNGWAECAVRIIKEDLKKMILGDKHKPIELQLQQFLFKYRNTAVTSTNESPSERMFIYRPKTTLEALRRCFNVKEASTNFKAKGKKRRELFI